MNRVEEAREFAERVHEGQTRKVSEVPMFTHLEEVAGILQNAGMSEEVVMAGYLHDTVEDTETTAEDIERTFGPAVAAIVAGHTEDKTKSWEERKQATIDELADPGTPFGIRALIIADRLSNLRGFKQDLTIVGESLWDHFKRGRDEQKWYYTECLRYMAVGLDPEEIPAFFHDYKREVAEFF